MTRSNMDPELEANFLEQRLADLRDTHPGEATVTANILQAFEDQQTAIGDDMEVRSMAIALGYTLAKHGTTVLPGLEGWLGQFVEQGALSPEQAATLTAQAAEICL